VKYLPMSVSLISLLAISGSVLAASDRMEDGHTAYTALCAKCHEQGVDGAPKTRDQKHWENRSNLWDAVLSEHATKGYLGMPPKGGSPQASDYDVDAAAEYMLTITHPDRPHD